MNKEDFNLSNNLIYLDNAATTLKPFVLSEAISDYYNNYSSNSSRADYNIALKVDKEISDCRTKIKEFINAKSEKEIVFTSGATASLNQIVFGYFKNKLTSNDEVLLSKSEHASNILPWLELQKIINFKITYINLIDNFELDDIKKYINSNTKVISIANLTNVIGDIRPIKEITKIAHENNMLVVVDGAQGLPHIKTDVIDLDIDFLAFSAHKMYGPTGLGIMYAKLDLLEELKPLIYGGGMNSTFDEEEINYSCLPSRLEAGTLNIAGIIGFSRVIDYINNIGMEKIIKHEEELSKYLIGELTKNENIIIYNKKSHGIVSFNYKGIFAQDLAIYLDKYNICVRSGNHCTKMLKDSMGIKNTLRVSLALYNTKEDIDKLITCLNNDNIKNEII